MAAHTDIFQGIEVRIPVLWQHKPEEKHVLGDKAGKNILIVSNRERGASDNHEAATHHVYSMLFHPF